MSAFFQTKFDFPAIEATRFWAVLPENDLFILVEVLSIHFPGDAYGIVRLFDDLVELMAERPGGHTGPNAPGHSSRWEALKNLTFEQYLDCFVSNDRELRLALSATLLLWNHRPHPFFPLPIFPGGNLQ